MASSVVMEIISTPGVVVIKEVHTFLKSIKLYSSVT